MSASNWAHCPRCIARATTALEKREEAIAASYGTVSVREFDEARKKLVMDQQSLANVDPTFREDYEIYGAEDGTVMVSYGGSCTTCHLTLDFKHEHNLYSEETKNV